MGVFGTLMDQRRRDIVEATDAVRQGAEGTTRRLIAAGQAELDRFRRAPKPSKTTTLGETTGKAGSAVGWGGVAHDGVTAVAKSVARGPETVAALERAFKPLKKGLGGVSAGLNFAGSRLRGEPLDVTATRVVLPMADARTGAALGGAIGFGVGEFMFPPGGGAALGPVLGFAGGALGAMYGEHEAERYAKTRAARLRRATAP